MMRSFKADLHIHSVLSPCGGLEMSPHAVVAKAKELKIEWLALTDHNTLANCPAYAEVAEASGLAFTYGTEIQTAEEIHLLAYFDDREKAMEFDRELHNALPEIKNDADFFGDQVVIDAEENIIRMEEKALSNSVVWDLDETVNRILYFHGFAVPAHIDAEANSILSQLGFLPQEPDFSLLGITAKLNLTGFLLLHPELRDKSFLRSSDAHYLSDLGSGTSEIIVEKPTVKELMIAAKQLYERKIRS